MSDFSIERILSPQLGPRLPPDAGLQQTLPAGFTLDLGFIGPPPVPVPVPVPVPCCPWFCGEVCYPCGFHHCRGVCVHCADAQLCYHAYRPPGPPPPPPRQKARMRTVFTDSQTRQLEALFEITDYPPVEARAQTARRTGLSEETVRVWFKNRRARRKRQVPGPGAQSPSPPLGSSKSLQWDRRVPSPGTG